MDKTRWRVLGLMGFANLVAVACTPAASLSPTAAPTNTLPPQPTSTPVPSHTPIPPTPTPITRIEVEDAAEDGFHCVTGELGAAGTPLPATADVNPCLGRI